MHRCLQLAQLGQGSVAPNPMVGAVLMHEDRIIGEGYHQQFGQAHAEVNAINAVPSADKHLISSATLYVSLEPCAHFGKTPPCADLIIDRKIPKVVIGCRDPFFLVAGKGIEKLQAAGVDVQTGILEKECRGLNKRFFTFHTQHRPYIILKWAQTGDGKMAAPSQPPPVGEERNAPQKRLFISNALTNRLVHKWRSEEMAILIGTNTALLDNPELTTRLWPGSNPVRLVVDMDLRLPQSLKLFSGAVKTIVFNKWKHEDGDISYYQVTDDVNLVHQISNALYQLKIQSVMVEGGARLLQSFIDEGWWDEARVITNQSLIIGEGLPASALKHHQLQNIETYEMDTIHYYLNGDTGI
ncbi:MAG: bifunctional diaminohydroxyphosphoribosylaminopyrimidine deaminase/5-amino-6-(5-phosphoribosylamino)uracil reductase RibD [Flavisolibacter sp.]|nr:bifunctional diaminohydroxyphosphoribosylaminopyrimidine deaminase/5-amino-6-(5-phosphoribosylamino)uracil reductase RibD [Flavisolibacter sp.]